MACSSKKLLVGSIFSHVAWEGPVVVLDFPKEGENLTFNDFTKFLEDRDVYFDIFNLEYQGDFFIKKSLSKKSWMTNQTFE